MKSPEFVSVAEAAEIAGCSDTTIRNKLRAGELEGKKIGVLVWLVRRSAVESMIPELSNRTTRNRALAAAAKRVARRRRSSAK